MLGGFLIIVVILQGLVVVEFYKDIEQIENINKDL